MVHIVWNGKKYSYKAKTLKMACILLAGELGFRKEWAYGTEIYKELSKAPTKGYWYGG
jgi:hypothetical protein